MASLRSESEILHFEAENGVALPRELCDFLLTNHHGNADSPWEFVANGWIGDTWDNPGKPFQWSTSDAQRAIHERINGDAGFCLDGDEDRECDGYLTLLRFGCGWLDAIVVNGEQTGTVWGGGNCMWYPRCDEQGRQLTFGPWYKSAYTPYRDYMNSKYAHK